MTLKLVLVQDSQKPSSALQFWVVAACTTEKNLLETRETNPDNKGAPGPPKSLNKLSCLEQGGPGDWV